MTKQLSYTMLDYANDYYEDLHIIAFNEDYLLARDKETNKAYFIYSTDENKDLVFCFSLLCEVGAMFQYWFVDILKTLKIELETVDTETDYYEKVVYKY